MIFDKLKNASLYNNLGERIQKAFEYLNTTDFINLEPGKYEIDGEEIFALVQDYNTKPLTTGKWEAHKKYIDLQYIISGRERMGFSHSNNNMIVLEEYNDEKDRMILKGDGNFLIVDSGEFVIFYPTDVHMPSLAINIPKQVKKVVVKVKVPTQEQNEEQYHEQDHEHEQEQEK